MLNSLYLNYFKCFKEINLPLNNLTILTGINSGGKSSCIQPLLLFHQTISKSSSTSELLINGISTQLGTIVDILDKIHGKNKIRIGLSDEKSKIIYEFEFEERSKTVLPITQITYGIKSRSGLAIEWVHSDKIGLSDLLPTNLKTSAAQRRIINQVKNLDYISAERIGPRETYSVAYDTLKDGVGIYGEFAPWFLFENQEKTISPALVQKDYAPNMLKQTEAWMNVLFPGAGLEISRVKGANFVTLGLSNSKQVGYNRPQNVGFGMTQILPIIIACLAAAEGKLLIVENPETHLHPGAQSLMGEFLARVATSGVQLIVETHSDHIINGIRKAIKKAIISHEKTTVHFFKPRNEDKPKESQVITPMLDKNGNFDHWPKGFFDQFDEDLEFFLNMGE